MGLLKERASPSSRRGTVEAFQEIDLSGVVSKRDVEDLELTLKRDLKDLGLRMIVRLGALIVGGTARLAALQIFR